MIPVMYPFSRYFDIPSTAMVILKSVNIFIGTTSTLAIFVLELLAEEDKVDFILQSYFPLQTTSSIYTEFVLRTRKFKI